MQNYKALRKKKVGENVWDLQLGKKFLDLILKYKRKKIKTWTSSKFKHLLCEKS